MHGDAAVAAHLGHEAARLDRMRAAAMLPESFGEHVRCLPERRLDVAEGDRVGRDKIGRQFASHRRAVRRLAHVGNVRQRCIVHRDQRRCVLREIAAVGNDHRHRLTNVGHLAVGEREQPGLVQRQPGIGMPHHAAASHHLGQIVEREHRMHAIQRERRLLLDRADERVRMRAAHERRVQQAGQRNVVHEPPAAAQQALAFQGRNAKTDASSHGYFAVSACRAARGPLR